MSLTITELRKLLIEDLTPFFELYTFEQKGKKKDVVEYINKHENGEDGVSIGILNYGGSSKLTYYVFQRDKHILKLLSNLSKEHTCSPPINKQSHTFTTSYELINGLNTAMYLPYITNKLTLNETLSLIREHCTTVLFPQLKYYSNLQHIDAAINHDDFWESDWRKPFNLGGNFIYKRLIIAKLADHSNFETVFQKQMEIIEEGIKGENAEDFLEIKKGVEVLNENLANEMDLPS